jgi:hypothetical protein
MHFRHGNATRDGKRGWFIGQFVPEEGGLRRRQDVELKWGIHPKGERRSQWVTYRTSTMISVLVEGRFLIWVRADGKVHEVRFEEKGDYVIINRFVEHTWEAPEDCIILTVRCPSVAGDQIERAD